jgi:hypothetical protein
VSKNDVGVICLLEDAVGSRPLAANAKEFASVRERRSVLRNRVKHGLEEMRMKQLKPSPREDVPGSDLVARTSHGSDVVHAEARRVSEHRGRYCRATQRAMAPMTKAPRTGMG